MEAWLLNPCLVPKLTNLNPLQFYTIKKEKAELGSTVQEAKLVWNREIFYSKTSSINGWRYDLFSISILILFQSFIPHFSESGVLANKLAQQEETIETIIINWIMQCL